jgi:hypothetical protein
MADGVAEFVGVTVSPASGRFGFRVEIPRDWAQLAIPEDAAEPADSDAFQPVAIFSAKYGAMVLTFSVHPGFAEGSVVEWFAASCQRHQIPVGSFVPARAGSIEGVQATGLQQTEAGPMAIRALMFEQGGWAHILMAMAPAAVWDSLQPAFDHMFASFAMTTPQPATVPLWPVGQPPQATDSAAALAAARGFLEAVKQGHTDAAKAFLVPQDADSVDIQGIAGGGADYSLGPARADGDLVVVEATLRVEPPGEPSAEGQTLPLVLRPIDGEWKVDMTASISRMLGVDVGQAMTQMAEGIGQAVGEGLKSAFEGLSDIPPEPPQAQAPHDASGDLK